PGRTNPGQTDEQRRGLPGRESPDRSVPAAILVTKRQGPEKVADRAKPRLGELRRTGGSDPGNPRDPNPQAHPDRGRKKVSVTKPSFRSSPWRRTAGAPVVSFRSLTKVPLATPISSMTYIVSPIV